MDPDFRFSSAPTISKTRVTSSNQQICRVDRESSLESYSSDLNEVRNEIIEKVRSSDAVIVSDYGKGFVTNKLEDLVRENANFVSIDPKPSR